MVYLHLKDLSSSILLTEKLHFVRFQEKSLWKSPDLTPPPSSQSDPRPKSPDNVQELVVYLGNGNQSEPVASPGNKNQSETQHLTLPQKVTN